MFGKVRFSSSKVHIHRIGIGFIFTRKDVRQSSVLSLRRFFWLLVVLRRGNGKQHFPRCITKNEDQNMLDLLKLFVSVTKCFVLV